MLRLLVLSVVLASAYCAQPGIYRPDLVTDNSRIIKGEDAKEGEFPYIVSLHFTKNRKHACGASVLTKRWLLTAGHCCDHKFEMYVVADTIFLSKNDTTHEMEARKIHPEYRPYDLWMNDACLIKLKTPMKFTKNLQQVTLPPSGYKVGGNEKVTIVGWGYTRPNVDNPQVPDRLQVGRGFIALDNAHCRKVVNNAVYDSHICVKGEQWGMGACNGDSGSPLTNQKGVQVGIASWVYQPCAVGLPDFYARLPLFIDWIKKELGSEASELKFAR
ncbi:UNVERIFIED_CONTAM: hypothetical protein PYX00_004365 [Menopon gallinae]|uniref:Peptidase S1 domain-containing protein n=1 Tax=Menopon gallinae TaxID=328185 RepID=A0AAW2I3F8_9NEOP